jgi:hypothetical protein
MCQLPRPLQVQLASSSSGDGLEWTQRYYCSQNWTQVLDNVSVAFVFTFLLLFFSCGALLQYLVYKVLTVIIFLKLISHNNRIKTFLFIHHISLVTFAVVVNSYFCVENRLLNAPV